MKVFKFHHDPPVKAGCCNWEASTTFWMAGTREKAEEEIAEHTPNEDRQNHGNCAFCLANLLADEEYEITKKRTKGKQDV